MVEKQLQIKVTPSDQQYKLVQQLIDLGYLKDQAAVVSICLNRALPILTAECGSHQRFLHNSPLETLEQREHRFDVQTKAIEFIRALAEKRKPDLLDLQVLADALGIPSESLAEVVSDCCCDKNKGGRSEKTGS